MNDNLLSNLALLDRFHGEKKDILEALVPFVEYAIYTLSKQYLDIKEIQDFVKTTCGICIPLTIIRTLLKKLKRRKLIVEYKSFEKIQVLNTANKSSEYKDAFDASQRNQNKLVLGYKSFSKLIDLNDNDVQGLLVEFVKHTIQYADITADFVNHSCLRETRFLSVAEYVAHIKKYDDESYKAFKSLFNGAMLSSLVQSGNTSVISATIKPLQIYLDSNFLFRILGFQSPTLNDAATELLAIFNQYKFDLKVFPETITEMRNSLLAIRDDIKYNNLPIQVTEDEANATDGLLGGIYRKQMSLLEIDNFITHIEEDIGALKIGILSTDPSVAMEIHKDQFDEYFKIRLGKILKSYTLDNSDYDIQLLRDLSANKSKDIQDSVPPKLRQSIDAKCLRHLRIASYITKLRKNVKYQFQDCVAIFLTCDKSFFYIDKKYSTSGSVPNIISDEFITNILWLNDPQKVNDAPINLVISLFQSSKQIDFEILRGFHKTVERAAKQRPDSVKYLGNIFLNQALVISLKEAEEIPTDDERLTKYEAIISESVNSTAKQFEALRAEISQLRTIAESIPKIEIVEKIIDKPTPDYERERHLISTYRLRYYNIAAIATIAILIALLYRQIYTVLFFLIGNNAKLPFSVTMAYSVVSIPIFLISLYFFSHKNITNEILKWTTTSKFTFYRFLSAYFTSLIKTIGILLLYFVVPFLINRLNSHVDSSINLPGQTTVSPTFQNGSNPTDSIIIVDTSTILKEVKQ